MTRYSPPRREGGGWATNTRQPDGPDPEFEVLIWLLSGAQDIEVVGVGVIRNESWSRGAAEHCAREYLAGKLDRPADSFDLRIWQQTSW